ncbi:MAG: hypothetical protein ACRERU_17390 [Methylococcales bacterium]
MKTPDSPLFLPSQGLPEALSAHLSAFASFFGSSTRDTTQSFCGDLRGFFQSERANLLRMSEVNEVEHQALQYRLTEGAMPLS